MPDRPDVRHPQDQAARVICEVAASTLETVNHQPDFELMVDRLGQAMGLLSHLAYGLLELQNPDAGFRQQFQRSFAVGLETGSGIVSMVADPAVS